MNSDPQVVELTEAVEVLLRQVHPKQVAGEMPSSEAFKPSAADEGLVSTHRERVGAEESYRRWTEDLQRESMGTFGISVGEVQKEDLRAWDDAEACGVPDHASVDFTQLGSRGKVKSAAKRLRDAAVARGCLHPGKSA